MGSFHPPAGSKGYLWILLHGLGSTKEEWDSFARELAKNGDGVLIYDARGHGESRQSLNREKALDYREWRQAGPGTPWDAMVGDLDSAVRFMNQHYGRSRHRIGVGGASLGANVALLYAAEHMDVPAVILLSPGLEYAGLRSEVAFRTLGQKPMLMTASLGDRYAFETVQTLKRTRQDTAVRVIEGSGSAHGVQMFKDPQFTKRVIDFVQTLKR